MKLQFDASQQYQLDAVNAVVDLFRGQPMEHRDFELQLQPTLGQLQIGSDFIVGNNLLVENETIQKNLKEIQQRNDITNDAEPHLDGEKHFSIEMETGTGKTYVYLRTIHELHKTYGFKKFVIVVPSIAIKEGVLKSLQITKDHFDMLYEKPEMNYYVYDSRKRGQLKSFAVNNTLQILVINIDSFAKFSEETATKNIIYQKSDWGVPVEYLKGCNPIVIVDEPQNMETEKRRQAIANLNPLLTLRYSATHRNVYNLIYKLDPVRAYDLGLVKKIEVDSVMTEEGFNNAYVEVASIQSKKSKVWANLVIDGDDQFGLQRKEVKVTAGSDLYELSGRREVYRNGFVVDTIDTGDSTISFINGQQFTVGQSNSESKDVITKFMIRRTIQNHLDKELVLRDQGIKVLSLFFIDRVANYREYDNGQQMKGKFALWFEEVFAEEIKSPRYKTLVFESVEPLHGGYFSQDKQGRAKDTRGDTKEDDSAYALIMKEKERLLSFDTPLRFIFTHSALREGWDSPNVFQICTLNETRSEIKKRQEIGRGLRLPVNQDGQRIFESPLNILTVVANESYEAFAKSLQKEIEDDCGVEFGGRIKKKERRKSLKLKKNYQLDKDFIELWNRIKTKTQYSVEYDTEDLIHQVSNQLADADIAGPRISTVRVSLDITEAGVSSSVRDIRERVITVASPHMPDVVGAIQSETHLTKDTIYRIILQADKFDAILKNPQGFVDAAVDIIRQVMSELMVDGIKYEKLTGAGWDMKLFESEELETYLDNLVQVQKQDKTLYDYVPVDSDIERKFAEELESRDDVKYYFKLPSWFKINTPLGGYNPDWALVLENDSRIYFVAETKGTNDMNALKPSERQKIMCGKKHFEVFDGVVFKAPIVETGELR